MLKLITITMYEREGVLYGNNIVEYDFLTFYLNVEREELYNIL